MYSASEIETSVCAVIVTYHPQASVLTNVELLQKQVAKIVVVDNSPPGIAEIILRELEKSASVAIIRNGDNLGIAAALNLGIRAAEKLHFEWVATFDQDSTVTPGFIQNLFRALAACPFKEKVALISPFIGTAETLPTRTDAVSAALEFAPVRVAMTSGSLLKTRVAMAEGLYDERLFIDYVDFDFCLRLWQHGYKIIRSNKAVLLHNLGSREKHSVLGFTFSLTAHNASRRYYTTRNRMMVYRRYALRFPFWFIQDCCWMFIEFTKIILFENNKALKFKRSFQGLWHGVIGVNGRFP